MNMINVFYEIIIIIIGCLFASFGISCLLLPNQLSSGGFSGIATILYYYFNIQMGTTILILNIPLFVWAFLKNGWKFTLKTVFATFLYSIFIDIFEVINIDLSDKLLASIYGGIFVGIGLALVFKTNTSTGGTDLIAHIAQNYTINMKMSSIIVIIDAIIVFSNVIALGNLEIGLYSSIAIFIIGKMIDVVFEGINFCKIIYIISDKYDEINNVLNLTLKKGATKIYGRGSYSNKEKIVIMCVTKRRDIEQIKTISKKIDSNSFIIVTDAREVYGLGFK